MIKKKLIYRQCIVTKEILLRKNLLRIVCINNDVIIDLDNKFLGRGFYIQKDIGVFQKLKKRMMLEKIFKKEKLDAKILVIYDQLENTIKNSDK